MGVMMLMVPTGTIFFNNIVGRPTVFPVEEDGIFVVFILSIVVHELLHAIGFLFSGAIPKFGVGMLGILPVVYTSTYGKQKLTIGRMLFAGFLPLVTITVLTVVHGLFFPQYRQITSFIFIINFAASAGDLYLAFRLLKYFRIKGVMILDTKTGSEIYVPKKS